jgi:hypothetical protein
MKAAKLSVTVPGYVMPMLELILTPEWCPNMPKGSMSALISNLLQKYLEEYFNTDILSLIEFMENNPEISLVEMTKYFEEARIERLALEDVL